ncbi:hypothetical protein CFOL_v3_13895 [Cephalotus follicularis]|uniref:Uncharacterized protein n=1 Tax=Cephalotus follicularis TaxID=3775 RepID=A0A1Q3BQQ7_CEPFO|nr:hypothetical protein CFOL_v3_13895 [Cephalotus follicularis]
MDEIEVVLKRFGDEQSTLLDQFERLSFEVQLNKAILGRSLSEPFRSQRQPALQPLNGLANPKMVKQGRRGSRLYKVLKKLLKPIVGNKCTKKDLKSGSLRF